MQTLYYTTSNYIRHTGNVVDLNEYRRRLERARQERVCCDDTRQGRIGRSCPDPRQRRERRSALLDLWASVGVLVMTVTFTLYVLCL